jgi:hypothetical protein
VLNARGRVRQGLAASGLLGLLAAGVVALAATVRTDREEVAGATADLVAAAARIDGPALEALLAADVRLLSPFHVSEFRVPAAGLDKAGILARVAETLGRQFPIRQHRILETQAEVVGPGMGRAQVHVSVVVEGWNIPSTSWWRLDWRREAPGVWRAYTITPLAIDGAGPTPR